MNALAPKDHNQAPLQTTPQDNILSRLEEAHVDMTVRHKELLASMERMPITCADEVTAQKLATFGNQLKSCANTLEERRKSEKKPYDDMASAVQGFFKGRIDDLNDAAKKVAGILDRFTEAERARKEREAAEARRKLEEEARIRAEEAQKHLNDAAKLQEQGLTTSANQALERAAEAETIANVTAQEAIAQVATAPTIVRGAGGGSAVSVGRWKAEITDISQIDLEILRPYFNRDSIEKALNGYKAVAVKGLGKDEEPKQIKGARIFKDRSTTFKS